jgi:uncharacterized membrane protein
MERIFDLFLGLPVHVLVNHLVIVFVPLFSVSFILLVFFEKLRSNYATITNIGLVAAFVSALIAKQSGEALSLRVGYPTNHAWWGERLVIVSALLLLVALIWTKLKDKKSLIGKLLGYVGILFAVAAIVISILAGHSGASASWSYKIESTNSNSTP